MTREELEKFDGEIVTEEQFREIEEHEEVTAVENCGVSGKYYGCIWYNVVFDDGEEISIYTE